MKVRLTKRKINESSSNRVTYADLRKAIQKVIDKNGMTKFIGVGTPLTDHRGQLSPDFITIMFNEGDPAFYEIDFHGHTAWNYRNDVFYGLEAQGYLVELSGAQVIVNATAMDFDYPSD